MPNCTVCYNLLYRAYASHFTYKLRKSCLVHITYNLVYCTVSLAIVRFISVVRSSQSTSFKSKQQFVNRQSDNRHVLQVVNRQTKSVADPGFADVDELTFHTPSIPTTSSSPPLRSPSRPFHPFASGFTGKMFDL